MRNHVTAAAVTAALVAVGAAITGTPAFAADRSPVPGSHPVWASAANRVVTAEATLAVTFRVYLRLRDEAGAQRAAQAVSSPDNPEYRRYLNPDQVRERFAPSRSAVTTVTSWLRGAGFRVGAVPANNLYVEATGTAAQVRAAFGADLNLYRVSGQVLRAADRDLTVPATVASLVSGVVGVDGALSLLRPDTVDVPPPPGFRNAGPCSEYWREKLDTTDPPYGAGYPDPLPYTVCGYTPGQLRSAYGIAPLVAAGRDGRGTTVAIVDAFASPTLYDDAAEYARRNDPRHPLRPDQFKTIVFPPNHALEGPDECDAGGWYGEQSLDVEAVHAMAPGADILYVGGSDCTDPAIDKALNEVVARNLASLISNSYGDVGENLPPATVRAFESIAVQAVLEGIGLYFSSGDGGDNVADTGTASVDFPASSPWVTAVGGTSLGIDQHGRVAVETGWETGISVLTDGAWEPGPPGEFLYGSGGGTSRLFVEPFYQRGVVPETLTGRGGDTSAGQGAGTPAGQGAGTPAGRGGVRARVVRARVVPDLSMVGDPNTGMLVGQTQTFDDGVHYGQYRIGGTSLSAPLLAGYVAIADQLRGHRHGFINPALYRAATRTGAIRDVRHVTGAVVRVDYVNGMNPSAGLRTSARTLDYPDLTIRSAPGYDTVTGLGTPDGAALLYVL